MKNLLKKNLKKSLKKFLKKEGKELLRNAPRGFIDELAEFQRKQDKS